MTLLFQQYVFINVCNSLKKHTILRIFNDFCLICTVFNKIPRRDFNDVLLIKKHSHS